MNPAMGGAKALLQPIVSVLHEWVPFCLEFVCKGKLLS